MKYLSLIGATALLVAAYGVRGDASLSQARTSIQKQYNKMDSAYIRKDVNGIGVCLGHDFLTRVKGERLKLNRAQYLSMIRASLQWVTLKHASTKIDSIKAGNKPGTMQVGASCTTVYLYQPSPEGGKKPKARKLTKSLKETDTWQRTGAGWMIQSRVVDER